MVKVNANVELFPKMSPTNPDCKLAGLGVHSLLLSLHSPLFRDIFKTVSDRSEVVVIVPHVKKSEIKALLRVMYGIEEIGFVSSSTLDTLGLDSYKGFVVMENLEDPVNEEIIDLEVAHAENFGNNAVIESTVFENNSFVEMVENPDENNSFMEVTVSNADNSDGNEKGKVPPEVKRFPCNICDKTFKTTKCRKFHMQAKHSSDQVFQNRLKAISARKSLAISRKCPLCEELCNSKNLKKHIKSVHPSHLLVEICEICQKKFSNGSHLNRHFDECHSESPVYACSFCDYKTKDKGNLKKHVVVHSVEKPFKCEECQFETRRPKEMKTHKCSMKTFLCDLCNKKSKSADGLRVHKKRAHSA